MKLGQFTVATLLAVFLALPAGAQTLQTNPARPAAPSIGSIAHAISSPSALVDINTASSSQLDALPGIGPVRAQAIVKNRPYKGKDDLLTRRILPQNVYNGIKNKIIARQG
jgi:DNA uptake protein ComE-like DNA-binding protein